MSFKLTASIALSGCLLVVLLLNINRMLSQVQTDPSWQLLIENGINLKSVLNAGKNLTFDEFSLYLVDNEGLVHSINKHTGNINWRTQIGAGSPFQINVDTNHLFIAAFDSRIYKIDKRDGHIDWVFTIPNQFLPDTEAAVDTDLGLVFVADRGGFLWALNKNTGVIHWSQQFSSIDNAKIFINQTIHFGFIKHESKLLRIEHWPSQTIFFVNKTNGEITDQQRTPLKIEFPTNRQVFYFEACRVELIYSIIDQPQFHCLSEKGELMWSHQTPHKINTQEVYQDNNRLYYFDVNNQLLSSVHIDHVPTNKNQFRKINFQIVEDFSKHTPYKKLGNQQIDYVKKENFMSVWLQQWLKRLKHISYVLGNYQDLKKFEVTTTQAGQYAEFSVRHQQNFYRNVFTDLQINAELTHTQTQEKLSIKGFYYDYNLWQVRAKLTKPGEWKWQITSHTPLTKNTQRGTIYISMSDLQENKNGNSLTLGLQDVIIDQNQDGNPLNQLGYAKELLPPSQKEDFAYLPFDEYLDLYAVAGINLFRYGPDNWAPAIWRNLANHKEFAMDVNGNLQGDAIIRAAKDKDMQIMMSVFSFHPPYTSVEAISNKKNQQVLQLYLDYIIARYASLIDVWELANEAKPSLQWSNFISDYLAQNDPYQNPITISLEEPKLNNSELLSIHYYPEWPKDNLDLKQKITKFHQLHPWPQRKIISEFGFAKANHFPDSDVWMRKFTWIFATQKIGLVFWNTGYGLYEHHSNGNIYLGPKERGYLKVISDFWPPLQQEAKSQNYQLTDGVEVYEVGDEKYKILYLLQLTNKTQYNVKIRLQLSQKASVQGIDPSSGKEILAQKLDAGEQVINLPTLSDDLAIKIIYK